MLLLKVVGASVRILVMNCNTTRSMTEEMERTAATVAGPGTTIVAEQPDWGPDSAEGYYDSFLTAAAVLDKLSTGSRDFDALVMAGFGEHGREGARELLDVPVVDVTEAAAHSAMMLGHKYGVVTTLKRAVPQIEDSLRVAGLVDKCAAIDAADLSVLAVDQDIEATLAALTLASERVIAAGAEVLVLGCAGMTGLRAELERRLALPVIDTVEAAVKTAESLVSLGLRTSKIGAFATPRPKQRLGWPVSGPADIEN